MSRALVTLQPLMLTDDEDCVFRSTKLEPRVSGIDACPEPEPGIQPEGDVVLF